MMHATTVARAGAVLVKDFPYARLITLDNPKALNALDDAMMCTLRKHYIDEPHSAPNALYVIKGSGPKSFCAGGDVVNVANDNPPGCRKSMFYHEYQVNHKLLTMPNAQVALWDGFVMGGGVGMSIHGRYRVASEKTLFAMPETAIGLFPDVGGSWFLPRLQIKGLGPYLGLSGGRVKGADTVHAGLATHFVPSASIPQLEEQLCNIADPLTASDCLASFAAKELPPFSLEPHLPLLERAFALTDSTTVEGILDALKSDGSEFALATARTMGACSPTALKVSLELQKRGAKITDPAEAFSMEYQCSQWSSNVGDFKEGVRALLVDKTKDPKWSPATLAEVTPELVSKFLSAYTPSYTKWDPLVPFDQSG